MTITRIQPVKICVKYNPPMFVMVYLDKKYGNKRKYKRFQVALFDNANAVAVKLAADNPAYFSSTFISLKQLCGLVQRLIDHQQTQINQVGDFVPNVTTTASSGALESVSKETTPKHEADPTFLANQITPDNDKFVYDNRKSFDPVLDNEWDDENADDLMF